MFKKFINTNNALFEFSHDNIKRIAVFLFPSFEKNIDNFVNNLHPDTFKNDSENDTKKKELYKKIENDTNICIANNTIPIVPDINVDEVPVNNPPAPPPPPLLAETPPPPPPPATTR